MAKSSVILDWCIVRLGSDHNWWVDEVSDPVRWDVDGLSIIDPRQMAHLIELVEPLRDYGFDQEIMESAFIPFRIEKEAAKKKVRLRRVKDSFFESEEKLFALTDILDEENGPYADLLDHLTRCRVKMLNDLFAFVSKLTVDEVEDEIREDQNADFAEGKSLHAFNELTAILDFMPAGWENEDGEDAARKAKPEGDLDGEELPELDEKEEEALKGDQSLTWDDEDKDKEEDPAAVSLPDGEEDEEEDEEEEADDGEEEADDGEKSGKAAKPRPKSRRR
jgi:ABC-type transporter Mla MlaB component